jgi:hypothetical protein
MFLNNLSNPEESMKQEPYNMVKSASYDTLSWKNALDLFFFFSWNFGLSNIL